MATRTLRYLTVVQVGHSHVNSTLSGNTVHVIQKTARMIVVNLVLKVEVQASPASGKAQN